MKWSVFETHCTLALLLRVVLIVYANFHDKYFTVTYTDVDYKVYTDAARFITEGKSPYSRHTYRYTPFLALILTPNIWLHADFGKLLFSIVDIIVGVLIKKLLLKGQCSSKIASMCAFSWLYNPMTIVISTRGNADSVAVMLVLLTLYYLKFNRPFTAGLVHGISMHFRLYPTIFSLAMFLSLGDKHFFLPNKRQLKLVFGCILSLGTLTAISYYYYDYEFLYESIIYHFVRKDARHNFSIYFYLLYLTTGQPLSFFVRMMQTLPPIILLLALSFRYSNQTDLPFAMFTQAMVMVTYNSVITSQYFFWYLSLLPLCIPYINISIMKYIVLIGIWIMTQGLWLFEAYLLEFLGSNTFYAIWVDSLLFFLANIKILSEFIENYDNKLLSLKNK